MPLALSTAYFYSLDVLVRIMTSFSETGNSVDCIHCDITKTHMSDSDNGYSYTVTLTNTHTSDSDNGYSYTVTLTNTHTSDSDNGFSYT